MHARKQTNNVVGLINPKTIIDWPLKPKMCYTNKEMSIQGENVVTERVKLAYKTEYVQQEQEHA